MSLMGLASHEPKVVEAFTEATANPIPTIIAYDVHAKAYLIGDNARNLARGGFTVIQDFKRYVAEAPVFFEGRSPTRSAYPDRTWPLRPDLPGKAGTASTKEVLKAYLQELFKRTGELPKQLVIGVPAIGDAAWQDRYRSNFTAAATELGLLRPHFLYEPFAVFQYYRHIEKLIPPALHALTVMIIDFGGGTLDCCVIETSEKGDLAKGGGRQLPRGIQSIDFAGKEVDLQLVEAGVAKVADPRLKCDPARVRNNPWILYLAEEAKISLSTQMRELRLEDDCSGFVYEARVAPGQYHPEVGFDFHLTGEDLKTVVKALWMRGWGTTVRKTVEDVKFSRGRMSLQTIDKVILAGGSSGLPFLRQLVAKTLAGEVTVDPKDVLVGKHVEKAVAYGLAFEAREQKTNRALKTHNAIGPCCFDSLFLFIAENRGKPAVRPYVRQLQGAKRIANDPGVLLSGPTRLGGFELEFEVQLPFRPVRSMVFCFCTNGDSQDPESDRLNTDDILRVPKSAKKHFKLRLDLNESGIVKPIFLFDGEHVSAQPFLATGLRLAQNVNSFAGIDFGTSNSYVVNIWAQEKEREISYPTFTVNDITGARLREFEQKLLSLRSCNQLTAEWCLARARTGASEFIFHSIKMEGSRLSQGETEDLLAGRQHATSKELREPVNVRDAYAFVLESYSSYRDKPEAFIRQLHKVVMAGLSADAGSYRQGSVRITGTEADPPPAPLVPEFMARLAAELKAGPGERAALHFAAEMHNKLVSIHPFSDGNGRTARLLMNAILLDADLPPLVISYGDKQRYFDCLKSSNKGDLSSTIEFLLETMETALQAILLKSDVAAEEPEPAALAPKPSEEPRPKKMVRRPVSERLAALMRQKIATVAIEREERYKAWLSAFVSFRQEFELACTGFNDHFGDSPFRVICKPYDELLFEKYDSLLRGERTLRTWFIGCEITGPKRIERFVFFFQKMTEKTRFLIRRQGSKAIYLETDVTLGVSRFSEGRYFRLSNEPIRLREVAYSNGQLLFAIEPKPNAVELSSMSTSAAVDSFFEDAADAYF